jgi:GT2 family glycosyltransferase
MDSAAELPTVTAIVIAYLDEPWLEQSVKAVLASTGVVADVVVVDNGCTDGGVEHVRLLDGVTVVEPEGNTGFAGGCNLGASRATGDYVALVNADAIVEPDALKALLRVAGRSGVGIATASVRLADQPDVINSAGNDIHCTGVSWSGGFGEKAVDHAVERDAFAASGAGMVMRRSTWNELGGFDDLFFAYYEDADLSIRAWQRGLRVVYVPEAVILHRYEFGRRPEKYFLLERNRLLLVLGCYEGRTLWYLAPLLVSMEIGFLVLAVREGWWRQKIEGWGWLFRHPREVQARRSRLQAARVVGDADLVHLFSDDLLPGNYEAPRWWPKFNRLVRAYWRAVERRVAT